MTCVMQAMSVWSWSPVTRVWPPSGTLATSATWGAPAGSLAEAGSGEAGSGRVSGESCHVICRINPKNLEELQILRQREQEIARNQQQQRLNNNNEGF